MRFSRKPERFSAPSADTPGMEPSDQSLFPRIVMGMVAATATFAVCAIFAFNMSVGTALPKDAIDLRGKWEFNNGPLGKKGSDFSETVIVPEPIRPQISGDLADEFWYRARFNLPGHLAENNRSIAVFLGTIKGEHEVYWNGERIGAGGKLVLGAYSVPQSKTLAGPVELKVRVKTPDHLFPGITHMLPVAVGISTELDSFREFYMFDSGVKPLILATFKFCLFLLFSFLFILEPKKREYFSFAFFVVLSAAAAACYSRYIPVYFDFYARNRVTFFFTTLSFSSIPWLTADILRMPDRRRKLWRLYGGALAAVFFSAILWVSSRPNEIILYQLVGRWLPVAVGLPSVIGVIIALRKLPASLPHRKFQLGVFTVLLALGTCGWWASSGGIFSFSYIPFPELWDVGLFAGLALSTVVDARSSARRSERAGKVLPKWFSAFLATGLDGVVLELPMIAMAVDTVGYTKILSSLGETEKARLHENIRARMAPLVERFGAQKLSDRGDGALFGWDFSGSEDAKRDQAKLVIAAAESLIRDGLSAGGVQFRIGIAAGLVRGELRGSETSFLGEPLNAASRLEGLAPPNGALLHETIVSFIEEETLERDWFSAEIKGVEYRARRLGRAA